MWVEFNSFVWAANKNVSIYRGESIKKIITLIPEIIDWCKQEMNLIPHTKFILDSLKLWIIISNFLRTSTIYNKNNDAVFEKNKKIK